ncbi:MAG: hypothetical protein U5N56_05280 [Candidatus Marinimicrobia bacterium]|nr:hypothetical protein [Candidatus Neomarinimicrobiota bacterium]
MKNYLLKGYALNQRMNRIENNVENLAEKCIQNLVTRFSLKKSPTRAYSLMGRCSTPTNWPPKSSARPNKSIVLIDNYIDENTLTHLEQKSKQVKVLLLSKNSNKQLALDVEKANGQYGNFEIKTFSKSHDRFLIINEDKVFHLGASRKTWVNRFAFSK